MFLGATFEKQEGTAWAGVAQESRLEYLLNVKHISYQEDETGELHFVFFNRKYFDTVVQMFTWDFTFLRGREESGIADSGTTTTLKDTLLTQANNWWNDATLEILTTTDGLAPQGESRPIDDFVAADDELQFSALPAAIEAGDTYQVKSGQYYEMFRWIFLTPFSIAAVFGLLMLFVQIMQGFIRL